MKSGDPWPDLDGAEQRVLMMQRKLHHWAVAEHGHRFDDLANLIDDPAFLTVAWARVVGEQGSPHRGGRWSRPARCRARRGRSAGGFARRPEGGTVPAVRFVITLLEYVDWSTY